jgi:hypothetical protein
MAQTDGGIVRPGDMVGMFKTMTAQPVMYRVVRIGAGGDLVIAGSQSKPAGKKGTRRQPTTAEPETVLPSAIVVRELPTTARQYPCFLALPRVVLLNQKAAAPHHVQVHKGVPFLANGYPFRLREEGMRWALAPPVQPLARCSAVVCNSIPFVQDEDAGTSVATKP